MRNLIAIYLLLFSIMSCKSQSASVASNKQPNIIIFYIDDMGYAQPSSYGGKLITTPNIDQLAKNGVRFTDGYVAAPICGPSRVGLMTGRYQARTGHDSNRTAPGGELDINEVTMAQRLKALGYSTGIVGKWHLGETSKEYLPLKRGFDYYVGHAGNINEGKGMGYIEGDKSVDFPQHPITSETWAQKSIEFIGDNDPNKTNKPFFLYLAFNAVHTPIVAKEETLAKLTHIKNEKARTYAGLIIEADEAIGQVMAKLREMNQEENTLIYCISDNGGAYTMAEMGGLRGRKWYVFEGGIRVPYIVQWKGHIPAGQVSEEPVIQLDVLPTSIAAAGGEIASKDNIDGRNILPLLMGKEDKVDRDALYWRFGTQFAIRKGDWKLVKALQTQTEPMLVNLKNDPGESTDLTAQYPEKAKELMTMWKNWNKQMKAPRWTDNRWNRDEEGGSENEKKPNEKKQNKKKKQ